MNALKKISVGMAAASALALSTFAAPAAGHPVWDQVVVATQTVRIADLDLATPAGQKTLQRRLQRAARKVCSSIVPPMPGRYLANGQCYTQVLQEAMKQVPTGRVAPAKQLAASSDRDAER